MLNTIKEKIKSGWEWLKLKVKKILVSLGIVGVALAAGNSAIPIENTYKDFPVLPITQEQLGENRDWNSVTIPTKATYVISESWLLEDKVVSITPTEWQTDFRTKWVNYLAVDGEFKKIDPTFKREGEGFVMKDAPFQVFAPLKSTGTASFLNNNRFNVLEKKTIDEPELTLAIQALGVADVKGKIETGNLGWGEIQYVIYRQAYPDYDADLIYWVYQGTAPELRKFIRFNSLTKAPTIDTSFDFKLTYDKPVYIQRVINGEMVGWTRKSPIVGYRGEIISKLTGSRVANDETKMRGIGMKPFKIWDSAGKEQLVKITMSSTLMNSTDEFLFSKIIPADFFKDAVFPVFTDTTSTFYPTAGAMDGWVERSNVSDLWSEIEEGAGTGHGNGGDITDTVFLSVLTSDALADTTHFNRFRRAIFQFDTSTIPDTDVISATTLSLNINIKDIYTPAGNSPTFDIYNATPASTSTLANGDYSNIGTTSQTGSPIAYASITTGDVYNNWAFNATGIASISKTGVSKFGLREATYDVGASTPTGRGDNYETLFSLVGYFSGYTGTTRDPKLVVTHATSRKVIIITE